MEAYSPYPNAYSTGKPPVVDTRSNKERYEALDDFDRGLVNFIKPAYALSVLLLIAAALVAILVPSPDRSDIAARAAATQAHNLAVAKESMARYYQSEAYVFNSH
jgi:hypothetical protein